MSVIILGIGLWIVMIVLLLAFMHVGKDNDE